MTDDAPAGQGDALAQPTRARLFKRLTDDARPVATTELAKELGLHPSGVRVHLERLRRRPGSRALCPRIRFGLAV